MTDAGRIDVIVNIDIIGLDQFDKVAQAAMRMAQSTDDAAKKMQTSVGRFERLRQALDKLEQTYDGVFRAGFRLQAAGRDLARVGHEILDSLIGVTQGYADYDLMLRRAAVALNTNTEWQGKLDRAIQDTAIALGLFSPEEVANAYYIWGAAAGVVVDTQQELSEITSVVEEVMIATAMAGGSLESNLNGVYAVMSQFQLPARRATDVVQALALMTERTSATFSDLTSAFTFIGPFADEMGVKFEDITSMLGLLADNGIKGSRAGRGLAMMLEGLSAPSGPAKAALDSVAEAAFGVGAEFADIVFDPNGEFRGMHNFVMDMAIGMRNLTVEERAFVFAKGFTNNATRAFIPLIKDQIELLKQGADAHGKFASALDTEKYSLAGAAEFFEIMREKALGSIHAIVGSFQNTFFPILQMIAVATMESIQPILEMVKGWTEAFTVWLRANPALVNFAVNIAGVVGVALVAAGAFLSVVGSLILFGAGIILSVKALAIILGIFGPFILGIIAVGGVIAFVAQDIVRNFEKWEGGIKEFQLVFSQFLNELGINVGDFGSMWRTFADHIKQGLTNMLDALRNGLGFVTDALRAIMANEEAMAVLREVVEWLIRLAAVGTGISIAGMSIRTIAGAALLLGTAAVGVGKFVYAVSGLKQIVGVIRMVHGAFLLLAANPIIVALLLLGAVIAGLYFAWQENFGGIRDIVANVIGFVTGLFEKFVGFISGLISKIGPVLDGIAKPFIKLFKENIPAAIDFVRKAFEKWGAQVGKAIDAIKPVIENIGNLIRTIFVEKIVPTINNVIERVGPLVSAIVDFLGPAWELLATVVMAAMGLIGRVVMGTIDFIVTVFTWFVENVIPILEPFFALLVTTFGIVFETIGNIVGAAMRFIQGVIELITGIISGDWEKVWNGIANMIRGIWDLILSIVKGAGELLLNIISRALQLVWNVITSVIKGILGWIGDRIADFVRIGGEWIMGLWNGITGFFGWLWDRITGFFGDLWNNILGFFGVHSPSTKFAGLGGDLIRGLWDGITGVAGWLWTNLYGFLGDLWDFFKGLPGKALELGGDIVSGIWDGITGLAGWLYDQVSGFMADIWNNVVTFWDNHSPSRRMMRLGEQLMQGLAMGLVDEGKSATSAMMSTMQAISSTGERVSELAGGQFSASSDHSFVSSEKKELLIKVDVTSSDGSVTRDNAETIGAAIHKGLMLDRLEHMATVG